MSSRRHRPSIRMLPSTVAPPSPAAALALVRTLAASAAASQPARPPAKPVLITFAALVEAASGFVWPTDRCLYCDSTGPFERDHFPVPDALGGRETVRACLHCHDLKDRMGETQTANYLRSRLSDFDAVTFSEWEARFIVGGLSVTDPWVVHFLLDDFRDLPPVGRIIVARRIREQLYALAIAEGRYP